MHANLPLLAGAAALIAIPPLFAATPSGAWVVYETARDNGHRLEKVSAPSTGAAADPAATITVQPDDHLQEIVGFGGALTESAGWVLAQLPPEARTEVVRRYYGKDGLGYTLARTHINSCDFSLNMWALDETPGDYDLHGFTLAPMRKWTLPLIHAAQAAAGADRFHLLASPWSPPAWMKSNARMDDGGSLRPEYAPAWANYFVKFCQAMEREENIPVWALTVQNEPEATQTWESCRYTAEQERDFVRDHLGPALKSAGLTGVHLLGLDHNRDLIENRAKVMLGDPATAQYLWGLGVHWYVSDDFAAVGRVHEAYPDEHLLFTEGCCEGGSALGAWEHGEHYATHIIGDFSNGVCGFIDWNIVLDQRGGPNHVGNFCDAPVIVDTTTKHVTYGPSFYYIGHFSKFVLPGAHRVASHGGPSALKTIGFVNPDRSVVIVVINTGDTPRPFGLSVTGATVSATIPPHAIQTFVRPAS
jgi:glucosylceramidase